MESPHHSNRRDQSSWTIGGVANKTFQLIHKYYFHGWPVCPDMTFMVNMLALIWPSRLNGSPRCDGVKYVCTTLTSILFRPSTWPTFNCAPSHICRPLRNVPLSPSRAPASVRQIHRPKRNKNEALWRIEICAFQMFVQMFSTVHDTRCSQLSGDCAQLSCTATYRKAPNYAAMLVGLYVVRRIKYSIRPKSRRFLSVRL